MADQTTEVCIPALGGDFRACRDTLLSAGPDTGKWVCVHMYERCAAYTVPGTEANWQAFFFSFKCVSELSLISGGVCAGNCSGTAQLERQEESTVD